MLKIKIYIMGRLPKIYGAAKVSFAKDFKSGMTYQQLSEKYGICKGTVTNLLLQLNLKSKRQRFWVDDHYFDVIDTEEKAYLLGFLIADGCIREEKDYRYKDVKTTRICFSNSEDDKEILDIIHSKICPNHKMIYYHNSRGAKIRKPQYTIQWPAPNTVRVLKEKYKILSRKTYDQNFVFPFETIPENLHRHFIRGFMDGDGSINWSELKFVFNSEHFMNQIIQKFSNLFKEHEETVYDFSYTIKCIKGKTTDYWRLFIPLGHGRDKLIKSYLYKDATIFLSRKYKKAYTKRIRHK